ncbi:MAG: NAD(P)/FAD-dependent oxidoreductase [Acidilobaceae archaeon]|nr:NAD(P)/FAD-dependent oxidoreductase [Acidilobaceae archaeon]MCX8165037.1 NAD(P)/FAD-dependent oxidoreductase [Acidilobaceae archaeon]MDW7974446.1 NAD(P)/FAD-dependent oxidoreductase [Sulfolobales archaeon]
MSSLKAAVVGGGFAGLIFSLKLLQSGVDVTLYEEHGRVGYPPHCTGIVSERVMNLIGKPAWRSVISSYLGLFLQGGGRRLKVDVKGRIYKLERTMLEELMLEEALSLGLRFRPERVSRVSSSGVVEVGSSRLQYDAVILAEGYGGSLRRGLSIGFTGKPMRGLNAEYPNYHGLREIFVIFDERISPGFFSWALGADNTIVAGLATTKAETLKHSLLRLERALGLTGRRRVYGGPVLTGPPGEKLSIGSVHVVGDAAGLTKPLTGGGLYPNSLAAELAMRTLEKSGDLNSSLSLSLKYVASRLRRQYALARILLGSKAMGLMISLASLARADLLLKEVDYDEHEKVFLTALLNLISPAS